MSAESVIRALQRAVEDDPADLDLRAHLAAILLGTGRGGEALAHIRVVIAGRPDDIGALETARQAALLDGDEQLATTSERLLRANRSTSTTSSCSTCSPRIVSG